MSTPSMRRAAMLATAVAGLQLFSVSGGGSETYGARRTVYYQDSACRLESFREYEYTAKSIEADGSSKEVDFGQCYPRGSTGAVTTCDVTDGTSTIETYLDTTCKTHLYSSKDSPACENLKVDGETCPPGGPASSTTDCTSMGQTSLTPGTFNVVGSPYADRMCEKRTGGDHIVSGEAFGVGNGDHCSLSPLVRGNRYSLSECMEDGTIFAQVYGSDDVACEGDIHLDTLMFSRADGVAQPGTICALGEFADGHKEYYRLNLCTHEDETEKVEIGPTPAPTPGSNLHTDGPDPAPVDYRGDGDDEDLREDSDDDDSDVHVAGTGDSDSAEEDKKDDEDSPEHSSSSSSSSSKHRDSSDEEHDDSSDKHKDSSSDDGHGDSSSSDDDHGTNTSGGSGGGGSGNNDLTNEEIFAIVFGCSVAVAILLLSTLLAFAGKREDDRSKVGPKPADG